MPTPWEITDAGARQSDETLKFISSAFSDAMHQRMQSIQFQSNVQQQMLGSAMEARKMEIDSYYKEKQLQMEAAKLDFEYAQLAQRKKEDEEAIKTRGEAKDIRNTIGSLANSARVQQGAIDDMLQQRSGYIRRVDEIKSNPLFDQLPEDGQTKIEYYKALDKIKTTDLRLKQATENNARIQENYQGLMSGGVGSAVSPILFAPDEFETTEMGSNEVVDSKVDVGTQSVTSGGEPLAGVHKLPDGTKIPVTVVRDEPIMTDAKLKELTQTLVNLRSVNYLSGKNIGSEESVLIHEFPKLKLPANSARFRLTQEEYYKSIKKDIATRYANSVKSQVPNYSVTKDSFDAEKFELERDDRALLESVGMNQLTIREFQNNIQTAAHAGFNAYKGVAETDDDEVKQSAVNKAVDGVMSRTLLKKEKESVGADGGTGGSPNPATVEKTGAGASKSIIPIKPNRTDATRNTIAAIMDNMAIKDNDVKDAAKVIYDRLIKSEMGNQSAAATMLGDSYFPSYDVSIEYEKDYKNMKASDFVKKYSSYVNLGRRQ